MWLISNYKNDFDLSNLGKNSLASFLDTDYRTLESIAIPSAVRQKIVPYLGKDCVVAYLDESASTIMVIKRKRKPIAIINRKLPSLNENFYCYNVDEIDLHIAMNIIEKKGVVRNEDEYEIIKKKAITQRV